MANIKTPMLNGGSPYEDSGKPRSTFEDRLGDALAGSSRAWNLDGKSASQHLREAAEQERKDAVRREIEKRVNEFVLKLLAQRIAEGARKAAQAKRPAPKARRVPPGMPDWQWPQQATGWHLDRNGKYVPDFD